MGARRFLLLVAVAFTAVAGCLEEGLSAVEEVCQSGEVCTQSFHGPISGKAVTYNIYLPSGYHESRQNYPAIYHLHGAGGDHTSLNEIVVGSLKQAIDAGVVSQMILIFPNGCGNSMWADSHDGSRPAETNVIWELVRHVDSTYRTLSTREFRIIQGSSMGGYGAAAFAAKYPELFSVCLILDGALHDWKSLSERRKSIALEIFDNNEAYYDRFSPWKNATLNADRIRSSIAYRMVVGSLTAFNLSYRQHLEDLGLEVDNVQTTCTHEAGCLMEESGLQNFKFISQNSGLSCGE